MNFLTKLFARSKTVDDIFDKDSGLLAKAGGWIGNLNYTDEEQAKSRTANMLAVQKFVVDTLAENTDRSKARRDIAVFFIKFYAILLFMAGMTYPISSEWSEVWFNLATSTAVGGLVFAISGFFFGSHMLARHNESKK